MNRPQLQIKQRPAGDFKPFMFTSDEVPGVWPEVEPILARCVEISQGMLTLENLYEMLCKRYNLATLFITLRDNKVESALILWVVQYGAYRAAQIVAFAGKNLLQCHEYIEVLDTWARKLDCVEIEGWCRPEMARLVRRLGWQPKLTMMTRDLRRKLQ